MASWKGRDCVCFERLYLAAHGAAVAHPLPRRQHLLAERRVATRETQSKALLLFTVISGTLLTYTQPESGQLCSSAPRRFLLFMVKLPGFAPPYIHLARRLQEASLPWHPSQLHGLGALSDLNSKDKWKIHWCATHIPPPQHHSSLNNLITPCETTQIPVQQA